MKTIRLRAPGGLDKLYLHTADAPLPKAGEILVKLQASSLNFHDYMVVSGLLACADGRIPMSDGAGDVLAVGDSVTEFVPGDAVISLFFPDWRDGEQHVQARERMPGDGMDGYAREMVVAPASFFTRAPIGYSHAEAATLPCAALTAWRALIGDGHLKPGGTVLIQGSGGVSVFALQFAKAAGARVIATSSSDEKLERLKGLGADKIINYRSTPAWGDVVLALTDGRGVDHIIEVGGKATLMQSLIAVRQGGHVAVIGGLSGLANSVPMDLMIFKQIKLQGLTVGSCRQQLEMIAAIAANGIRPVLDRHFCLEEMAEAFRYQRSGAHFGKIVLDINA